MMGSEIGPDPVLIKRCTLLHDIGKALTHEVQGSHALIGAEIARKYGESSDVVHAIEAHYNEVEVRTVEAVLTQAADACSGSRPAEAVPGQAEREDEAEHAVVAAFHGGSQVAAGLGGGCGGKAVGEAHRLRRRRWQVLALSGPATVADYHVAEALACPAWTYRFSGKTAGFPPRRQR